MEPPVHHSSVYEEAVETADHDSVTVVELHPTTLTDAGVSGTVGAVVVSEA
jgi:hypothetical protein